MKANFFLPRGFTLMEVLVALVILAIAFTATLFTMSTNIRNSLFLQNKTAADFVAFNVISETKLGMNDLSTHLPELSGTQIMFDKVWYWTAVLSPSGSEFVSEIHVHVKPKPQAPDTIDLLGYINAI